MRISTRRLIVLGCAQLIIFCVALSTSGAVQNTAIHLPPLYDSFVPPAVGGSYRDATFGVGIKRMSDSRNMPNKAGTGALSFVSTEFSTASPFNSDNSRLILQHQSYFGLYDGNGTYVRDLPLSVNASAEPRWSRTDPNALYYVSVNALMKLDVNTGVSSLVRLFAEYAAIRGRGESDISRDGDHFVFAADERSGPGTEGVANRYVFVYEISSNTKGPVLDTIGHPFDNLYIAPDNGVAIGWLPNGTARFAGIELFDRNMTFERQLAPAIGHMHLTRETNGDDVLVWTNGGNPVPNENCQNGIVKIRLRDAQQTCLLELDWSLAVHITAPDSSGWAFVETYVIQDPNAMARGWVLYSNEILQVKLDGTETRRLLHHRSRPANNYGYQPRATVSRDGSRLVFTSNHGLQAILGYPNDYTDAYFVAVPATINSFSASNILVNPLGASTLSWSASLGASLTLNGVAVSAPSGSQVVNPGATTSYTLVATDGSGSTSRTVTVHVNDGTMGLGTPIVTSPSSGQTLAVTGVGFTWTGVAGATGYDMRIFDGTTGALLFTGSLSGAGSTSTLISLPAGSYPFAVRACTGGFAAAQCGAYGTVLFTVSPAAPTRASAVTSPTQGSNRTSSTQTLSWTAVLPNPLLPGLSYEVLLKDLRAGTTALQITVPAPTLSTIFTMRSSTLYELKVRACQAGCGPWSPAVTFSVTLPPVPTVAPTISDCTVSGGNSLTCNWGSVLNADAYQVQLVQAPPAGPGGGALTGAAMQVSATTVTLPVPAGPATVFIAACNGDGCGPNATTGITPLGPNPLQANIGTPMAGTVVNGPGVFFTWNRVPGDNGTNTLYRLFVQDLSRQATALDAFTTSNFYSAFFKAEGARYDALVVSNPGLANQATGLSQGFNVSGASATAPTPVSPSHNSTLRSGNIQLGWSPVPGATLYEYFVAVLGQGSASARGVTPGLLAQVPLTGTVGGLVYSGIVRACPAGATCVSGSDAGWGPWSNAQGGPGVTNFTVTPSPP